MWFGASMLGRGVSRYQDGKWQTFTTADGLANNSVNCMLESSDGAIWFGTYGSGVSRYQDGKWQTFTSANSGLVGNIVNSMLESSDGAIWFGTNFGASRYDGNWQTFTSADGLANNSVDCMLESPDSTMWFGFGMYGDGVSRYEDGNWETFITDLIWPRIVHSMLESSDGTIWLGMQGGVCRYQDGNWRTFTSADSGLVVEADGSVWSLLESSDRVIWCGTGSGVSRYQDGKWQPFAYSDASVWSLLESPDGVMWFGTQGGGVNRYQDGNWRTLITTDGLAGNKVKSMLESDDAIWFATWGGGVSRYQDGNWQTFTAQNSGLANNYVYALMEASDEALWFGTHGGGVSRYLDGSWQTFTAQNSGLVDNYVHALLESSDGAMWFGTAGGVSRFRRPTVPLARAEIIESPPPIFGSDRFFFEFRRVEIASERRPPVSYALISPQPHDPLNIDWEPFRDIDGFQTPPMGNGDWIVYARAIDQNGNTQSPPSIRTFTVDLTAPTVVIAGPRRNDAVSGEVTIAGSIFDASYRPDLKRFVLYCGKVEGNGGVAEWVEISEQQISAPQTFRIEDGVLGTWKTEELPEPFGNYMLRIWAEDNLGHTSEHTVPVTVVSALEALKARDGGSVEAPRGTVSLMVPPNGLGADAQVQIAFRPASELPALPLDATAAGIAYEVGPGNLTFNKRSTLAIGYEPVDIGGMNETDLAIFMLSGGSWTRLGGTVDAMAHKVSVGIEAPGTYALFESASADGSPGVSDIACQPRIISPAGGMYPSTTDITFKLGAAANVNVLIYGASGNLIAEVEKGRALNAGLNTVRWDGKDRNGKAVRDGIYIVVIDAGGKATNKTVAVLNR